MHDPEPRPRRERLQSIDLVRGLAMVLMALDHARDYFDDPGVDPMDLRSTNPALYLTRWVTHFCAPTFVFLAGTSAFLFGAGGRSKAELSRFLLSRGLWLVVLEFTLVKFAWVHSFGFFLWFQQVIAAIGSGMMLLAGLVWLPRGALVAVGVAIVCGHNLLDGTEEGLGGPAPAWFQVLHVSQVFIVLQGDPADWLGSPKLMVIYPLLPWWGVIVLGYACGPVFRMERRRRRRVLATCGACATLGFFALRASNLYGDPVPWTRGDSTLYAIGSFFNAQKYPPSLLYVAMTLGPALLLLAAVDRTPGRLGRALVAFGRVPLFYYLAHLFVLSYGAALMYWITDGQALNPIVALVTGAAPPWLAKGLPVVYVAWVACVLGLYLPCVAYGRLKARGRSTIWSYL